MGYERIDNKLIVIIEDKIQGREYELEVTVCYEDGDTFATPEMDVRINNAPQDDLEEEVHDELHDFCVQAKNRKMFLYGIELHLIFDLFGKEIPELKFLEEGEGE